MQSKLPKIGALQKLMGSKGKVPKKKTPGKKWNGGGSLSKLMGK